jgi:hypothetical protein
MKRENERKRNLKDPSENWKREPALLGLAQIHAARGTRLVDNSRPTR